MKIKIRQNENAIFTFEATHKDLKYVEKLVTNTVQNIMPYVEDIIRCIIQETNKEENK